MELSERIAAKKVQVQQMNERLDSLPMYSEEYEEEMVLFYELMWELWGLEIEAEGF